MSNPTRPRVGLAFSGGGFRAAAFGLGAMRALNDRGILPDVRVVSGISGGSLLTAMWAYGPADFAEFDASVNGMLRTNLRNELFRRAMHPRLIASNARSVVLALPPRPLKRARASTRTEALVSAFAARTFGAKHMDEVTHPGLDTIISATDLSTGNAVRFGSAVSSCSPHGLIAGPITVAEATAASAAFPALLPQLNRTYTFTRSNGVKHRKTMLMTDGGVYDNLALSPILPGRSARHTSHVYDLDHVIAVDAGVGRSPKLAPNFMTGRLLRSFEIAHTRSQDGMRALIHEHRSAGRLQGLTYVYLGMPDNRLPVPVSDLVSHAAVKDYPTDFSPVPTDKLGALTNRAEQLTRALIDFYCPDLGQ